MEGDHRRAVVIDLADYLMNRRRKDQVASAAERALPLHARVRDQRHEQQMAHRRRMLAHLAATAAEYA